MTSHAPPRCETRGNSSEEAMADMSCVFEPVRGGRCLGGRAQSIRKVIHKWEWIASTWAPRYRDGPHGDVPLCEYAGRTCRRGAQADRPIQRSSCSTRLRLTLSWTPLRSFTP